MAEVTSGSSGSSFHLKKIFFAFDEQLIIIWVEFENVPPAGFTEQIGDFLPGAASTFVPTNIVLVRNNASRQDMVLEVILGMTT